MKNKKLFLKELELNEEKSKKLELSEAGLGKVTIIPYSRNPNFSGREYLLDELYKALHLKNYTVLTQAIAGLGGVSKTQLALGHSYRFMEDYDVIWWLSSEELSTISADYAELAEGLFLLNRTGQDDEMVASSLSDALGDLPLAFEQAGAYIKETGITLRGYLDRFHQKRKKILMLGKPTIYPDTIATAWNISFEVARREAPLSSDLLNLYSYLASDQIPGSLLVEEARHLPEPLASAVKDVLELDKTVASLRRYSLISYANEGFSIHRMVQAMIRDKLTENDQKKWSEVAVKMMNEAITFKEDDIQTWEKCSIMPPLALATLSLGP